MQAYPPRAAADTLPEADTRSSHVHAGLLPRLGALALDAILLLLIGVAWSLLLDARAADLGPDRYSALMLGFGLVPLLYYTLLEGSGGTLGKRALRLRTIAARNGGRPGIWRALARGLMHAVDWLPLLYVVGIVTIAASQKKQRLGDRVAGTLVVRV
jgi:uncharacterized RDD family membrane protein YckC